ncbi:MAG: Glu-tRNA(Gln) amidotransferase subunit GatD [Candidatus Aenigmarchaeota archaeon]|nr:Glu-tRNA(Gln) amidotransferase subunit GatD [Candidatus Aenigmarchaeota archaeon]
MAYSVRIDRLLKAAKAATGDRISVSSAGRTFEGMLMPQTGAGDPDKIVIKLDSGYNIGVSADEVRKLVQAKRAVAPAAPARFDPAKPAIAIISTGGTITSKIDYNTGGVTSLTKPEELLSSMPDLAKFVNVRSISMPFNIMSESMNHEHWQLLARECAKELNRKDVRGVIVTHGTDTLHFTSAALSFFLRNLGKPVVVTGSQRSSDRGSSDAAMNLLCSAITAAANMAEVGICMHGSVSDNYCSFTRGTRVRKMHTSRRDAFKPINETALAKVWPNGEIERTNPAVRVRDDSKAVELDDRFEPNIAMLQTYPGSDPTLIDHLINKGCRGFVVQATGLGQVPSKTRSWLPHIKRAVDSGVPVFLAAETIFGRLNCSVYSEGRAVLEAGAVPLEDMLAETAYVKLGWVLGHTKDMAEIRKMMLTNYAGEITERSTGEGYLE